MKSHSIKILVLTFSALLLAGCHKLEATTRVQPDGSGEFRMGVGFSAEERANLEKQGSNTQEFCNTSQTAENATVIEEQRGDETWCITVTQFEDLEELRRLYEQGTGIKINRLEIRDGKFYHDIEVDTLSEDSDFSIFTDITWSVILPGTPIEHNADQVEGNTATWTVTPESESVRLRAESEVPRTGFSFPACGGTLILLVSVLFPWLQAGEETRANTVIIRAADFKFRRSSCRMSAWRGRSGLCKRGKWKKPASFLSKCSRKTGPIARPGIGTHKRGPTPGTKSGYGRRVCVLIQPISRRGRRCENCDRQ